MFVPSHVDVNNFFSVRHKSGTRGTELLLDALRVAHPPPTTFPCLVPRHRWCFVDVRSRRATRLRPRPWTATDVCPSVAVVSSPGVGGSNRSPIVPRVLVHFGMTPLFDLRGGFEVGWVILVYEKFRQRSTLGFTFTDSTLTPVSQVRSNKGSDPLRSSGHCPCPVSHPHSSGVHIGPRPGSGDPKTPAVSPGPLLECTDGVTVSRRSR